MKHVQRRHFFVRDMVESYEIEVPFVETANNIADFFTKPMHTSRQFYAFRRIIMNEPAHEAAAPGARSSRASPLVVDRSFSSDHVSDRSTSDRGGASVIGDACLARGVPSRACLCCYARER